MDSKCFNLSENQFAFIRDKIQEFLKDKFTYEVFVFGSRARGDSKKYSDLDLWIQTSPHLTRDEIQNLNESFINSELSIKIDLLTPENVLSEYLPSIEKEKKFWFKNES
jgi:uncharacterized protein